MSVCRGRRPVVGLLAALVVGFAWVLVSSGHVARALAGTQCPSSYQSSQPSAAPGGESALVPPGAVSAVVCRYRGMNDPAAAYFGQLAGSGAVSDPSVLAAFVQQLDALVPIAPYPLSPNGGPPSCPARDDNYFVIAFTYASGPEDVLKSGSDWCVTLTNGKHESSLTFSSGGPAVWSELDALTGCKAGTAPAVGPCDGDPAPATLLPSFTLGRSTGRLRYKGRPMTFTIRIQTGASTETAGIGLTGSGWPDRNVDGTPLQVSGPAVSGAGTVTGHFASSGVAYPPLYCQRGGFLDGSGGVDLTLPPNSVTTLAYRVTLAAPPWPGLTPTLGAFAYVPLAGSGIRQLGRIKVPTGAPTGVRITLTAPGARRPTRAGSPFVIRHARAIVIRGTTAPAIGHARVRVWAKGYPTAGAAPRTTPIGTAVTNSHGRFSLTWRNPAAGTYQIDASLRHPGRGLIADHSCDLPLTVS